MMLSVSYHFYCQHVYDARLPIGRGLKPVLCIQELPFWIYTTLSFFKNFSPLPMCVLNILSILKKKKGSQSVFWAGKQL